MKLSHVIDLASAARFAGLNFLRQVSLRRNLGFLIGAIALPAAATQITAGPMLGHATTRTASLWLQTDGPAEARLEYWPESQPQDRRLSAPISLDALTDYTARMILTNLEPDARYRYTAYLDGKRVLQGVNLSFATLPHWKWRGPPPDFTVYLGSSAYLNDPAWDRPDQAFGGDPTIFRTIAGLAAENRNPHFMLWLGDNVYFRVTDYESPSGMNLRYRVSRATTELQPLLRATRHYAVWDDHDYGPNNGNRSFVFKKESLDLFQRYWLNPSAGLPNWPGSFTTFSFLDADFFLLDDRYYRASDTTVEPKYEFDLLKETKNAIIGYHSLTRVLGKGFTNDKPAWLGEEKVMFGLVQMDWLKQALINSTATFKVVVSGSQLFNDANALEGWQNFEAEREPFVEWLSRQKIPGVIFLSGDRQHTELIRRERKNGYPLYELTCSPLTSKPGIPDKEKVNDQRVKDTLVVERNFCSLDYIAQGKARTLVLRVFDASGKPLWEHRIKAAELIDPTGE